MGGSLMAKLESLKLGSEGSNPSPPASILKEIKNMGKMGYIYLITNKTNGMQYVGQTSRDILIRFDEHCYDNRSNSKIHQAIKAEGVSNFKLEELEKIPLDQLDAREIYWINKLDTCNIGYNIAPGGNGGSRSYNQLRIVENGFIIDSKEELAREMARVASWGFSTVKEKIAQVINTDKTFCDYHFESCTAAPSELTDIVELENWIKTLNQRFQGKRIHCEELNLDFETTGEAAQYFVQQGLYQGQSKMPIQSIVSAIGQHLHGKTDCVASVGGLHFCYLPGSTKNKGAEKVGVTMKVYCPELDKTFNSQVEAAHYMIDNKIWKVTLKTAKLRISDIIRGIFPEYKGYTFIKADKE